MTRVAWLRSGIGIALSCGLAACAPDPPPSADATDTAAPFVRAVHEAAAATADLSDPPSFADARRGFIAAPQGQVHDADGNVIWDFDAFDFVAGDAPPTVHPSLWRQALLNNHVGLFKVTDGIWQLRGFDLANMTLIEGASGFIVVDALTSRETAAAALAFARQHLGDRPVSALVFTHSHADHFGGALGVISAEEARERAIPIIAPSGFMAEATSENLMMGVAMGRRAGYMYGRRLPRDARGLVDTGLGKAVAFGSIGILPPTLEISADTEEHVVDGVRLRFHNVPETEAPAEFVFAIPERRAFCGAELMSHTLHNLYTLRGAKVRDGLRWAAYLDRSLAWAGDAEVLFNQHHWPVWGQTRIAEFVRMQRDSYKYIHDQTVRLMNAGLTAPEIAETLELPPALHAHLNVRGYYGTVRHNVKAVYQYYLGWYDGHPSNLDPHPTVDGARRWVALAGGSAPAIAAARAAYDAGDFRWAAQVLREVVLADPGSAEARELLARSFEQLGYLAESAPWRNVYLSGALELREGPPETGVSRASLADLLRHAPVERFLEAMAAAIDGPRAAEQDLTINLTLSDLGRTWVLRLSNGVLLHAEGQPDAGADASLALTHALFVRLMTGEAGAADLLLGADADIEGSRIALGRFFGLIQRADGTFPIVER
jgi:alkyl sulfatase BDS1-like metallo-beta-lactamase superfamily hydrolase